MIELERLNARLGPLAVIAREYAGPEATPDERKAALALVASVLRQTGDILGEIQTVRDSMPSGSWDAEAREVVSRTFDAGAGVADFLRNLGEVRGAVSEQPDTAGWIGVVDVLEEFYLELFAAAQRAERQEAAAPALTPAEADALRRYDDRMLYETVSPLALLAGGLAGAGGLFAAGPVAMAVAGLAGYVSAIAFFEWSLRRVMR